MLEELVVELSKSVDSVKSLNEKTNFRIAKLNDKELHVETESHQGENSNNYFTVSFTKIKEEWKTFLQSRIRDDENQEVNSFLTALFSQFPFVEIISNEEKKFSIMLKEFQTDEIPSESIERVIEFLKEVIDGTYVPKNLSQQISGNLYRIKSSARQDLRLLGFLNKENDLNHTLIDRYRNSPNNEDIIRELILGQEYFKISLFILSKLEKHNVNEKKKALIEFGKTVIRNSRGDNLMLDTVAKKRTQNLLTWLIKTGLIKEDLTINAEKEGTMNSKLRNGFLKIMNEYLAAKEESFAGHKLGSFVRNDITKTISSLINDNEYTVTGSVGKGNWTFVPWVAVMNKKITNSTQRGYYIVYLFSEDMKRLYLTIAQGVTETSRDEMIRIKNEVREKIEMDGRVKKDDKINLGSSHRAKDYELSTAAYIPYEIESMPSEIELVEDLKEMIRYYEEFIALEQGHSINKNDISVANEDKGEYLVDKDLVEHISSYIESKGFYYDKEEIKNLFLSMKTKPFVILSGISGTGKTKVIQWIAESLGATEENGQFVLIPVRPDWSDSSDLLGYVDLQGEFQERPLLTVLRKAADHKDKPYFVVLDEMNLARVEYYFSDILSVMESRAWKEKEIETSAVLPESIVGERITIPPNVYILGTLNMDETTHPLSKKVLDRANTIEFNEVKLDAFDFLMDRQEVNSKNIRNDCLKAEFLHLKDCFHAHEALVRNVSEVLVKINEILEPIGAQVGYRVRDEICFYMAYNEKGNLLSFDDALDYQIYQKILPRISGSDGRTEEALKELYKLCKNQEFDRDSWDDSDWKMAKYPRSAKKLSRMLRRFDYDGFTSFWL